MSENIKKYQLNHMERNVSTQGKSEGMHLLLG